MQCELGSGAKLTVNPAPYEDAIVLRDIVLKSLRSHVKDISELNGQDPTHYGAVIMDLVMEVATQPEFDRAMLKCAERASWNKGNGEWKIDRKLFDNQIHGDDARQDHVEIAWHIVEVNVLPFLKGVFSRLKGAVQTTAQNLKSS